MAQRKKRPAKGPKKRPEAFNKPLEKLATFMKERHQADKETETAETRLSETGADDAHYFLDAMSDVTPLKDPKTKVIPSPNVNLRPAHPAPDDELEAMTHLSDLVKGAADMDITFSDEYMEGAMQGVSPKWLQKLRRGQFPVQDHVDLHGLTKEEAKIKIREFLVQSYGKELACVLVIHGRGLNSQNHIPVLKERIPVWLARGRVKKIVLAFSTARPYDGGTGAIYVLLRKRRGLI